MRHPKKISRNLFKSKIAIVDNIERVIDIIRVILITSNA